VFSVFYLRFFSSPSPPPLFKKYGGFFSHSYPNMKNAAELAATKHAR
jgi:hypothetical protein